jgi:hypothetical protein
LRICQRKSLHTAKKILHTYSINRGRSRSTSLSYSNTFQPTILPETVDMETEAGEGRNTRNTTTLKQPQELEWLGVIWEVG